MRDKKKVDQRANIGKSHGKSKYDFCVKDNVYRKSSRANARATQLVYSIAYAVSYQIHHFFVSLAA
jgi:hypothetical protein